MGAPAPYLSGHLFSEIFPRIGYITISTYITRAGDVIKGLKKVSKSKEDVKGIIGFPGTLLTVAQIVNDPENFKKRLKKR
ncbi:MAG: hypothetical protein QXO15_11260 [Nitrososphaerota archaeon]